jgi:hypothetical protein
LALYASQHLLQTTGLAATCGTRPDADDRRVGTRDRAQPRVAKARASRHARCNRVVLTKETDMLKTIAASDLTTVCGGLDSPLEHPQPHFEPRLQERAPFPPPIFSNPQVPPYTVQTKGKQS